MSAQNAPTHMQIIGKEVAIAWEDGTEHYLPFEYLRQQSPSAENIGEKDIFGNQYGGDGPRTFPGIEVTGWSFVGNYAVAFEFSDGHRTGLYAWQYLRSIGEQWDANS